MSKPFGLRGNRFAVFSIAGLVALGLALSPVASGTSDAKKAKGSSKSKLKAYPKKAPGGTAFYYPQKKYPKRKFPKIRLPKTHGKLVWVGSAGRPTRLEQSSATRKVLYTSRTVKNKNVVVSGTISIPKGKAPAGGWPIISYGHGTTGLADQCAPSREDLSPDPSNRAPYVAYTDPVQNSWLAAGYAVLRTDYEGLGTDGIHPFLVGQASGRSVLDIVRAARQTKFKLSKDYFVVGHSQGGHAALWAAGLAPTWLPEMRLKGTVAYAPASTLDDYANVLPGLRTPSSISGLAAYILRGLSSVDAALKPAEILTPEALALFPKTLTQCLAEIGSESSFGALAPSQLLSATATDELSLRTGAFHSALAAQQPAVKTSAPILIPQGMSDTTTPPPFTNGLVRDLKELNGDEAVKLSNYPGVDHSSILDAAGQEVLDWMKAR